jgi:hypothetical protein
MSTGRDDAVDPHIKLAELMNREFGTSVSSSDVRRFISDYWDRISWFAHSIHNEVERDRAKPTRTPEQALDAMTIPTDGRIDLDALAEEAFNAKGRELGGPFWHELPAVERERILRTIQAIDPARRAAIPSEQGKAVATDDALAWFNACWKLSGTGMSKVQFLAKYRSHLGVSDEVAERMRAALDQGEPK